MSRNGLASTPRRGQALVELAIVLPLLLGLAGVVIQVGSRLRSEARFSAANSAVLRVAYRNDRDEEQLRRLFLATLGVDEEGGSLTVEVNEKEEAFDGLPAVWIETSYVSPHWGILPRVVGSPIMRARQGVPLQLAGTPGSLFPGKGEES